MGNIEKLEYLLNISKEYKFMENEKGENVLKIRGYYETDKTIYINFTKLIQLLKNYTGINEVLSDTEN